VKAKSTHPPPIPQHPNSNMANISWTTEAEAKLKEIPFFVRPAARKKIEKFAQERGASEINVEIYDLAKKQFG
jgi:Proto-chlorophyllide reductase 57 kD subunit